VLSNHNIVSFQKPCLLSVSSSFFSVSFAMLPQIWTVCYCTWRSIPRHATSSEKQVIKG